MKKKRKNVQVSLKLLVQHPRSILFNLFDYLYLQKSNQYIKPTHQLSAFTSALHIAFKLRMLRYISTTLATQP